MITILMDFILSFYVSDKPDNHFVVSLTFTSFYLYFWIFENQNPVGNVIQLDKQNKPKVPMFQNHLRSF